jgi:hypothetical protein
MPAVVLQSADARLVPDVNHVSGVNGSSTGGKLSILAGVEESRLFPEIIKKNK